MFAFQPFIYFLILIKVIRSQLVTINWLRSAELTELYISLTSNLTKFIQALKVGLDHDCLDLLEGGGDLWIEPGVKCSQIVRTRRELDMHDEKNWNQVKISDFLDQKILFLLFSGVLSDIDFMTWSQIV